MNAAEIARALGGRKAGAWWSCRCPAHDDHNPSLGVRDGDRSVIVRCFAGCDSRDVIGALQARGLWDGRDDYRSRAEPRPRREPDRAGTTAAAREIWRKARPAAGTIVARYLAARGIEAPIPPTLRFLAECWHRETRTAWPVMLAAVTRWPDREPCAVHRTFLERDGTDKAPIEPAKKTLGAGAGGAVRLAPAGETLALAEGIETALAVMVASGLPTWAALSAGNLAAVRLPDLPLAAEVVIAADHDASGSGQRFAGRAAERLIREGRRVRIAFPPTIGTDFNDMLAEPAP